MNSDTISIIALCISIVVALGEYFYTKQINQINLDSQYYDEIYKDFLMVQIPEKMRRIQRLEDGTIVGTEDMRKVLREMRKKSLYFSFYNKKFYEKLIYMLQNLDDKLVMLDDNMSINAYIDFQFQLEVLIRDVYDYIAKASRGKYIIL